MSDTNFTQFDATLFLSSFFALVLIFGVLGATGVLGSQVGDPPQLTDGNESLIEIDIDDFPDSPGSDSPNVTSGGVSLNWSGIPPGMNVDNTYTETYTLNRSGPQDDTISLSNQSAVDITAINNNLGFRINDTRTSPRTVFNLQNRRTKDDFNFWTDDRDTIIQSVTVDSNTTKTGSLPSPPGGTYDYQVANITVKYSNVSVIGDRFSLNGSFVYDPRWKKNATLENETKIIAENRNVKISNTDKVTIIVGPIEKDYNPGQNVDIPGVKVHIAGIGHSDLLDTESIAFIGDSSGGWLDNETVDRKNPTQVIEEPGMGSFDIRLSDTGNQTGEVSVTLNPSSGGGILDSIIGALSSIPIIGGLIDAGSDLASGLLFIAQILIWGIGTVIEVLVSIILMAVNLAVWLVSMISYLLSAWFAIGGSIGNRWLGLLAQGVTFGLFIGIFNGMAKFIGMIR